MCRVSGTSKPFEAGAKGADCLCAASVSWPAERQRARIAPAAQRPSHNCLAALAKVHTCPTRSPVFSVWEQPHDTSRANTLRLACSGQQPELCSCGCWDHVRDPRSPRGLELRARSRPLPTLPTPKPSWYHTQHEACFSSRKLSQTAGGRECAYKTMLSQPHARQRPAATLTQPSVGQLPSVNPIFCTLSHQARLLQAVGDPPLAHKALSARERPESILCGGPRSGTSMRT